MKKSKFIMLALGILAGVSMMAFTACGSGDGGDGDGGDKGGAKSYTIEAEGCNLSGLAGHGFSDEGSETGMIFGENKKAIRENSTVLNSLSNKYFIAYFNTPETTLRFNITADSASENNTLTLRLGSEFGTLRINPEQLEVKVNGTALDYNQINVTGSSNKNGGYTSAFKDYPLSSKFALNEGANVITLTLKDNTLGPGGTLTCVGPGVDCIKVKTTSVLTWESMWESNKEDVTTAYWED